MTGAAAESWARLRLVQGDSSAQVWELVASRGQTTLTVGSGPSSSWVIREEGVRPLHFSLHWDGATLRIADTYGAGDVRVDGAQVTAQWKAIVGRARIDFGKAAMVAETSAGADSEAPHPLEPSPLPPMGASAPLDTAAQARSFSKHTLLGVSPQAGEVPVELVTPRNSDSSAPNSADSSAPQSTDSSPPMEGTGSFRVARPSDSERARKATLVGMVISAPPPAPLPVITVAESQPPASTTEAPPAEKPATPPRGIPTGTLMGVVGPLEARVQRLASAAQDAKLSDKRTMIGVPMKDLRLEPGLIPSTSRAPSDVPGSVVTQAEMRSIAAPSAPPAGAKPGERIGSTWQEIPNAPRSGAPPMAVLIEPGQPAQSSARVENDVAPPRTFAGRDRGFDTRDRVSDIPTQMRDVGSLDSRRPKSPFPLRYLGIVVLTAAAYLAWLYLLDHL